MVAREPVVDEQQILKAVTALLKHIEAQQQKHNELFDDEELLYLVSNQASSRPDLESPLACRAGCLCWRLVRASMAATGDGCWPQFCFSFFCLCGRIIVNLYGPEGQAVRLWLCSAGGCAREATPGPPQGQAYKAVRTGLLMQHTSVCSLPSCQLLSDLQQLTGRCGRLACNCQQVRRLGTLPSWWTSWSAIEPVI